MAVNRDHVFDQLVAALRDARGYVEASSLNINGKADRKNYRGCLARIDAALCAAEAATPIERGDFVVADPNKAT
jgi:hypothetical protein